MVEMAIVLPVLMLLLFAIVEFGWVMMMRHQLVLTARDSARFGTLPGVDEDAFNERIADRLGAMGLANGVDGVEVVWTTFPFDAESGVEAEEADASAQAFFGFDGANRFDMFVTIDVPYAKISLAPDIVYGWGGGEGGWAVHVEALAKSELDSVNPERIARAVAAGEL